MREFFACMRDRFRILIERKHVGASLQNGFGVTAAAAGCIDNQRAGTRREQFDRFRDQHRPMISKVLHFLRLLFQYQRTGREPDGPLK